MKHKMRLAGLASLLLASLVLSSARGEETLWNLSLKKLAPGQPLTVEPFVAPCAGPQKVVVDPDNPLVGAAAVGALTSSPLLFTKGSTAHYTPSFTLKANAPYSSGIITVKMDILFDKIVPVATHPIQTLVTFHFIDAQNASTFFPSIALQSPDTLWVSSGLSKINTPPQFKLGEVAHWKAVLDLDKHTIQFFLNDVPISPPDHDDAKLSSFLGLTIQDGSSLGGNYGETFSLGIANLIVTHG